MAAGLVGSVMTAFTATVAALLGGGVAIWGPLYLYALILVAGLAFLLVVRRGFDAVAVILLAGNIAVSFSTTYLAGGVAQSGANIMWGIVAPITAMLFFSRRSAAIWFVVYVASIVWAVFFPRMALHEVSEAFAEWLFVINMVGVAGFVTAGLLYFLGERDKAQRLVEVERARSDSLLRNILPDEIALQLKDGASIIADHFEDATVLFADIADFTPLSATMAPDEIVEILNEAFSEFDRLADKYGVEKIKTIGDCYMAAAGVPVARTDHAHVLALMALDIQRLVAGRTFRGHRLRFRIGLNSGPLVAGVIGERKFIYDLWGDTVNTASRMESHGVAGTIQVTDSTRRHLEANFVLSDRGTLAIKGKGEMPTFILEGERQPIGALPDR